MSNKYQYGGSTHGYEELFSNYMSMLESASFTPSFQEEQIEENISFEDDTTTEELDVLYNLAALDELEQSLNDKLLNLEERLLTLDYNFNPSDFNVRNNYNYNTENWNDIKRKQMLAESAGNPNAVSHAGAKGLFQFLPTTFERFKTRPDADIFNPKDSEEARDAYMNYLLKMFDGDMRKALASYNWGEGNVQKNVKKYGKDWDKHLPKETTNYLKKISGYQYGGTTHGYEELFSNYMGMLENAASSYTKPSQSSAYYNDEDSDFEEDEYGNSLTNEKNSEEMLTFETRITELTNMYNEKLNNISSLLDEIEMNYGYDFGSNVRSSYDYNVGIQENNYTAPDVDLSSINFKSSGKHGLNKIGPHALEIGNTVTDMLGYTPTFNSIYRDKNQQQYYINKGIGAKNSWHLTGNAIDVNPKDWNKLSKQQQDYLKSKYNVVYHNNHYHIEPKKK